MEVSEILAAAQAAVDQAGLREEFQIPGFGKAVDILASVRPGQPTPVSSEPSPVSGEASRSPTLARIAGRLGVPADIVADVYFEDVEGIGIGLSTAQLERSKAGATKQLALLYAAGQQGGGYDEEWTSLDSIRRLCNDFGKLDDGNFAATIQELGEFFQVRGSRRQREVRLKRPGFEEAARLVLHFAGERGEDSKGDEEWT